MSTQRQIFDALLEPCFVLNKDLKVIYCNETASVVCGMSARKIMRQTFPEIFQFTETLDWMTNIAGVTDATPYKETKFTTTEGSEGKVQITCQKWSDDNDGEWIVFVRDVTLEERLQNKYRGELERVEHINKNLEKMVEERTSEIRQLNRLMAALLDSLEQGFFVFGKDGLCHDFSSKACERVLGGRPNKRPAWEVLGLTAKQAPGFDKWLSTIWMDMLPFEDLAPLGPATFPHAEGLHIKLDYFPLTGEAGTEGIVVVASDITSLIQAQKDAASEHAHVQMILDLIQKRQQVSRFARETQSLLKDLGVSLKNDFQKWDADEVFRILHTVKGGCSSLHLLEAAHVAHEAESLLSQHRAEPTEERAQGLRHLSIKLNEKFAEFMAETKNILGANAFSEERIVEMPMGELAHICKQLSVSPINAPLVTSLKTKYFLEPAHGFFAPYDDVVQQVAGKEGKSVLPLVFENADLSVFGEVYSPLFATFVHSFRNAVDHGIETPAKRLERGKPESGTIKVSFKHESEYLTIQVADDGNGIDPTRIREKLAGKGFDTSKESDDQVIQHVFDASFSTRDQVTETSGRGVGMDAIRAAAEALGGTCHVVSKLGSGSTLVVKVPWYEEPIRQNAKAA